MKTSLETSQFSTEVFHRQGGFSTDFREFSTEGKEKLNKE